MNILIVGGAGYIGGAVTDLLSNEDWLYGRDVFVRVYDSLVYEDSYRKPVSFVFGDIRDRDRLLPHLRWADCVIWLAALVGDGACAVDPAASVEVNQAAVEWLAANFDRRIIFLSTCSVYGAADAVLEEFSPTNPLSVYASTKLAAESYLRDKNAIIFRLGTLFGVSDLFSRVRFDLVVNTLTLRAHRQGKISVFGGDQFRPLLHVKDAAQAIVDAIGSAHTGIYNLHYLNMRIKDLANVVANRFPDVQVHQASTHFEDNRNYQVCSRKAEVELGFNPMLSVDSGIREIKELLDEGRLRNPDHSRYVNDRFLLQEMSNVR